MTSPLTQLSETELRAILLTCDGRGKEVKEQALEELIRRLTDHLENVHLV